MNAETVSILKTVGQIAGIGGLSLGVFLLLFRDVIRKLLLPKLEKEHAYKIIRLIVILIFLIAAIGIGAFVYMNIPPSNITEKKFPPEVENKIILKYLALLDGGQYSEAYNSMSQETKEKFSEETFKNLAETWRKPKGHLLNRIAYGRDYGREAGGIKGRFSMVTFLSNFEHGSKFLEAVTFIVNDAEKWEVYGYNIGKCELPYCNPNIN